MKDNKLIAEFMGIKFDKGTFYNMGYDVDGDGNLYRSHELKYHNSWDWLMPVVEKCLIGEAEQEGFIYYDIYEGLTNISLSETYEAVIEFINEYNGN